MKKLSLQACIKTNNTLGKEYQMKLSRSGKYSINPSSIIVYLFDAHKGIDEYPAEQPVITEILESTPSGKTQYVTAMTQMDKGKTVFEEVNEIVSDTELTGKNNETKTSVFKKYFEDLAKKLPSTIPAKQPFQPIFF